MEMLRSFLCPICNELCKIQNGDYLFSYNFECSQGHKQDNLDQEFLLKKRKPKQNIFKCKNHRKKNQIHCYTCNEDICMLCFKDMHNDHKIEYLKNLKLGTREEYNNNYNLNKQKEILQIFLTELNIFQSKFNLYIDTLKENLKKHNEFRAELIKNISTENNFSFIDIENFNIHSKKDKYKKLEEFIEGYINKSTFIEKYEYLKGIFNELIKKGKYIEEQKIVNKINNYIDLNLMPLNHDNLFVQCKKNYISNNSEITIFQETSEKDEDKYYYKPIISKVFPFIINKCPILLENVPKISNEISFYCISDNSVLKIMIKSQIKIGQSPNYECVINIFNTLQNMALTVLSKDKNIIFDSNSNIILYDDTFSKETSKILDQRLPGEYSKIENALTLDEDSLVFTIKKFNSIEPFIYSMKIDEENIYKINTNGLTPLPLFYMKAKKLLISFCFEYKYNNIKENNYFYICLINFACTKPEIIQMININYYDISKKVFYFNCFNDDSFYFPICQQTYNNEMFYKVIYISQYKLIKGEFREISRIKKEDDFSLKKYNCYGS